MDFESLKFPWSLQKIQIFFNGKITKENKFPGGIDSSGLFNEINFELAIGDMNILFYDQTSKAFLFALVYEKLDDGEVYETRFVLLSVLYQGMTAFKKVLN